MPLSVLDLVPRSEGMTPADAIETSRSYAARLDALGYHRLWVAEPGADQDRLHELLRSPAREEMEAMPAFLGVLAFLSHLPDAAERVGAAAGRVLASAWLTMYLGPVPMPVSVLAAGAWSLFLVRVASTWSDRRIVAAFPALVWILTLVALVATSALRRSSTLRLS